MTPGDYPKKEYFKDNDVHAEAGDEDRTMYGGSAPATWRLGSTIRSRRSAKTDMESVARVKGDDLTLLTSVTRKETAVRCVSLILRFSSLYFHFIIINLLQRDPSYFDLHFCRRYFSTLFCSSPNQCSSKPILIVPSLLHSPENAGKRLK
jgi:hypothetical protein